MPLELLNPQAIDDYLEERAAGNGELARLLKLALAKPLRRRSENLRLAPRLPENAPDWAVQKTAAGIAIYEFAPDARLEASVRHVADWLHAALLEGAAWLKQIDPIQRNKPQRFKKIDSLERAVAEADKDMRIRNKALAKSLENVPAQEGEKQVAVLSDGFRMVQLLSPTALDREGVAMGHCIGQGAYDEKVAEGSHQYFSLRDAENRPHATLEVATSTQEINQCYGKVNHPPVVRYRRWIAQWIKERGLTLATSARDCGLVQSVDGSVHSLDAMPEGMRVARDLDLSRLELGSLPAGLEVSGNLDLTHSRVKSLPETLKVGGSLHVAYSKIPALPARLEVGGALYLTGTEVGQLPEGLKVGGDLYLGWTNITQLPEGLEVGGDLDLRGAKVSSLPDDLKVGGQIFGLPKHADALTRNRLQPRERER